MLLETRSELLWAYANVIICTGEIAIVLLKCTSTVDISSNRDSKG